MGAPNDPRIMSTEELEEYARQFEGGEDINLYDVRDIQSGRKQYRNCANVVS